MKMNPNEWKLKSFIAMGQCGTMWDNVGQCEKKIQIPKS